MKKIKNKTNHLIISNNKNQDWERKGHIQNIRRIDHIEHKEIID